MESQSELVGQDNNNTCLVCLSAQGGVHFQIVSCRACSGFFKRSINLDKKYRCRRGTYDCSGYPELCRKCKYCRFKRCQQLGMSIKEKPFGKKNDDEQRISTSTSSATSSNSPTISIPENSSLSTPEMLDRDLFTIDEVLNIFRRNEKISQGMPLNNILNSTVVALKHYIGLRFKDVSKNMEIDAPFDFVELKTFHQDSFIYNAQLLMNFDAFIELGFEDKVFVYRTYWPLFSVFGDFLLADRVFGKEEAKETETKSSTPVIHNFLHTIISNIKDPKENAANLLSSSDVISVFKMEKVVVSAVKAKLFKSDLNKQNINFFDLTMLQRGCIALTYFAHICDIKEPSDLKINTSTTFERLKKFKNQMYLNYASLLLIIPEYSSLCNEEKLYLYRTFWPCFSLFSNVILTLHLFGEKSQNLYFIADEDTILDINSDEVKNLTFLEGMSRECRDIVKTSFDYLINNILKPIKEMDLDNTECAYLTFQILWSPKTVQGLSDPTKALAKSILKQIGTELHHHYIYFKKLDNYIFRLTEITKLINAAIEQCLICKNEIMIGKMFGFLESLYDDSQISSLI
uniref:Nuclear receptor n=1 Tax=Rhabditophanes sp. KR3021 TaxID=114890 RepID=A0AC35UFV0_9BILA